MNAKPGEQHRSSQPSNNKWDDLSQQALAGGGYGAGTMAQTDDNEERLHSELKSVPTELHMRGADDVLRTISESDKMSDGSEKSLGDIANQWRLIGGLLESQGGFPEGVHPSSQESLYALITTNPTVLDYRKNVLDHIKQLRETGHSVKGYKRAAVDLEHILYARQLETMKKLSRASASSQKSSAVSSRPHVDTDEPAPSRDTPIFNMRRTKEAPYEYQTRGEHSRSLEDAERFRALETLREIGLLIPFDAQPLYHGRARTSDERESWHIQPGYRNTRGNVGVMPALYTGDEKAARDYARYQRMHQPNSISADIHEIASRDPDATVLDFDGFSAKYGNKLHALPERDRKRLHGALEAISLDPETRTIGQLSGGARVIPDDRHSAQYTADRLRQDPAGYAYACLTGSERMDRKYFANWLRANHIVGVKVTHHQNRIGHPITSYIMIDETKIEEAKHFAAERKDYTKTFLAISKTLAPEFKPSVRPPSDLMDLLSQNPNATPEQILNAAKDESPSIKSIYESSAENWEGFTISEHTETVLRNFHDTYGDTFPVEMIPVMNMLILSHDLGKGEAKRHHVNQKTYSVPYADQFMELNGLSIRTRNLLTGIIGDGQELTTAIYINHERPESDLTDYCKNLLNENGITSNVDEKAQGLAEMCHILQECDSKAYTSMGITRRETPSGDVYFRNYDSFRSSFGDPIDITGRQAPFVGRRWQDDSTAA